MTPRIQHPWNKTKQHQNNKTKTTIKKALSVRSAIPHPRVLGAIRECGGKMHMAERRWRAAHSDFFEAFRCYDEAGSARRVACLKYLVLATMLMGSDVDPFESQVRFHFGVFFVLCRRRRPRGGSCFPCPSPALNNAAAAARSLFLFFSNQKQNQTKRRRRSPTSRTPRSSP